MALIAAGVLTTTGCTTGSDRPTRPTAPSAAAVAPAASADPAVNYGSAEAVCDAFARTLLSVDTTTDRSSTDALARTAPYVTGPLLASTASPQVDARWQEWVSHRARTEVTTGAYAGDAPEPSTRIHAARLARVTPVGNDGWRGPTHRYAVYCELDQHNDQQLRVSAYTLEPLGG